MSNTDNNNISNEGIQGSYQPNMDYYYQQMYTCPFFNYPTYYDEGLMDEYDITGNNCSPEDGYRQRRRRRRRRRRFPFFFSPFFFVRPPFIRPFNPYGPFYYDDYDYEDDWED